MLEDIEQGRQANAENELRVKLNKYQDGYYKSHMLLEVLQKDKDTWKKKLDDVEEKEKETITKEKSLRASLDTTICSKRELEDEVSNLQDKLVLTTDVYIERAREQVFFFYPQLDLFKVVYDFQLVDDEEVSLLRLEEYSLAHDPRNEDSLIGEDIYEVPCLNEATKEEETHGDDQQEDFMFVFFDLQWF